MANTLNQSISEGISEWMKEQEENGEGAVAERPATFDDFLKAQRQMSFKRTNNNNSKRVSFVGDVEQSLEFSAALSVEEEEPKEEETSKTVSPLSPESNEKEIKSTARLLQTMNRRCSRISHVDSSAWQSMVHELDVKLKKLDADGHFKDASRKVPWYAPPYQRQRWGDEQVLPIVNHGTLFFDLFFVGAVYNLAEMIISAVAVDDGQNEDTENRFRTMLYFLGIFGPIFSTWETGVYYQSRYLAADYSHQVFELLRFLTVAAMVLFTRPLQELADPQNNSSVFMLVLAFLCESLMQLTLDLEVYFRAEGDREAIQNHSWAEMKKKTIPLVITYLISTVIAGVFYFGPYDEPLNTGAVWNVTDLPLTLTAAMYEWDIFLKMWGAVQKEKGVADIRKTLVPYNIDFVIQRYSDWFLLILGEVVMAMVETNDSERNYVVAMMGSLTLIVLFTLKFESEPDNPFGHALWRNTRNAHAFRVVMEGMFTAMVTMSVSFKLLSTEGRYGLSERDCVFGLTVSIACVLIALELTLITHKGILQSWKRLFRQDEDNNRTIYWPLGWITVVKVLLIIFLLSLPLWVGDNSNIAVVLAFLVVLMVAATRIVGWAFVFKEDEIKEMVSTAKRKLTISKSFGSRSEPSVSVKGDPNNDEARALSLVEEGSAATSTCGSTLRRDQFDVYHGMFDAVIFTDYEGEIVSVNTVAVKMFRYHDKNDMLGMNVAELVGGGHAKHHSRYLQKFQERGGSSAHIGKQRLVKARRKDGTEFKCIVGVKLKGDGKHLIGFIRDMEDFGDELEIILPDTETKSEKQLRRVLDDSSFDSIAVIDLGGTIVGVNRTFVEEFRYDSKEEVIGLDIGIIMDMKYHALHEKKMERYRETREMGEHMKSTVVGKQKLLPALRKDGTQFNCIVGVNEIEDSDLIVGYIKNVESFGGMAVEM